MTARKFCCGTAALVCLTLFFTGMPTESSALAGPKGGGRKASGPKASGPKTGSPKATRPKSSGKKSPTTSRGGGGTKKGSLEVGALPGGTKSLGAPKTPHGTFGATKGFPKPPTMGPRPAASHPALQHHPAIGQIKIDPSQWNRSSLIVPQQSTLVVGGTFAAPLVVPVTAPPIYATTYVENVETTVPAATELPGYATSSPTAPLFNTSDLAEMVTGPDLAVVDIHLDRPQGANELFNVVATMRNVGGSDYVSAEGGQALVLYKNGGLVGQLRFTHLPVGQELVLSVPSHEDSATYEAQILFVEGILSDDNPQNDDFNPTNDSQQR